MTTDDTTVQWKMIPRRTGTRSRTRRLITVAALVIALVLAADPILMALGPRSASAAPVSNAQELVDQVNASGVPAIATVVTRGDHVEVAAASGESEGRPVNEHTQFRIESLSKSFTATAVVQLVENGQVDLNSPVVAYLPDLRIDDDRAGRITVRQLLNQSSGITDTSLGFNQYANTALSPREACALLSRSRLGFDPGTEWSYSNPNYWILAWLVEEVSQREFGVYLRQEILEPLGMAETISADSSGGVGGAHGHSFAFGAPVPVKAPNAFVAGAGGIASSAHDMSLWLRFQHGALPGSDDVLGSALRDEMHRAQAPDGGMYGFGWYSGPPADGGVKRVSHSGTGAGTSAYEGLFPDEVGIAVLQASSRPDAYSTAEGLYRLSTTGSFGTPPRAPGPWVDIVAVIIALALLGLSGRGIIRARKWAAGPKMGRRIVALMSLMLTVTAILTLPIWGSLVVGRSATWPVLFAGAPVPVIALWAVAGGLGLLAVARITSVMRLCVMRLREWR